MKHYKLIAGITAAASLLSGFPVYAEGEPEELINITTTADDENPIPDKYNTGASGSLSKVALGATVSGVAFKAGGANEANVLNFAYPVAPIPDTAVIENCDFSDYKLTCVGEDLVTDRDVRIIFRNCRFGSVSKEAPDSRVFFQFENCSLTQFTGSNASFTDCAFGGSYMDGMHPFRHVSLTDCYFSDFNYPCTGGEYHTDGVHIFGKADVDVTDLTFDHCRFEIPYINVSGSEAYVNACFMLSPEYSYVSDVEVRDCIMNGGGYTIYASDRTKNGTRWTISDSSFTNVRVGEAHLFGDIYPNDRSEGVTFTNFGDVDSLYIGSVWKENDDTCFSVTNDTTVERTLKIVTDQGTYTQTIPASPGGKGLRYETGQLSFPIDQRISVPGNVAYAICIDATDPDNAKQIRYVNYGTEEVAVTESEIECNLVPAEENGTSASSGSGSGRTGSGGSSNYEKPAHTHKYAWVTTVLPTVNRLGEEEYRCEGCGRVLDSRPIDYTANILKDIRNTVTNAPLNGAVTVETGGYISLDRVTAEALQNRNDVTVSFAFEYQKQRYEMTVPAGFDWVSTLNEAGWTGFLYIGSFPGVVVTPVQ